MIRWEILGKPISATHEFIDPYACRMQLKFFLEKEEDPRPLHLGDAYGHFINYSHKALQNQYNSKTKAAV